MLSDVRSEPPAPRPAVTSLPAYKPGKALEVAMAEHDLTSAVKLASNENPYDPLPEVREALAAALGGLPRYPDHRATAVREALADRIGITADRVTVGCGSVGILQQLLLTYVDPGDEVLYGWRSFEAYPIYTRTVGGTEVTVPNRREALDIDGIVRAVTERTRLVMITSPNNPTGTAVAHEDLVRVLDAVPASCLVVLDEAYHEYVTGAHVHDAPSLLDRYANLAVLRTFSKAYGLAALRIGYLFGHPEVIAAVDRTLVPFAVNGLAQVGALASLAADEELGERVNVTIAERARVQRALRERGFSTPDAQANFVWMPAGEPSAALTLALEKRGVVTRPFPGEGVRVTIGSEAENDRFLDAFDDVAAELPLEEHWRLPTGAAARAVQGVVDRIDELATRAVLSAARPTRGRTAPDPGGTETWDAGQVWAHLAELTGYWPRQLAHLVDAEERPALIGRALDDASRIDPIAAAADGRADLGGLVSAVGRHLDAARSLVAGLSSADWDARGVTPTGLHHTASSVVERPLLAHVAEHLDQLDGLGVVED
jgi:histidinol-phosphate aminotransferase